MRPAGTNEVRRAVWSLRAAAAACVLPACLLLCCPAAAGQVFHMGLDFTDSQAGTPPFDAAPFLLTGVDNNFVLDGGLVGWSEESARRGVALAVEDAFTALDTGQSDRRPAIQLHIGPVDQALSGRRLNVRFGDGPIADVFGLANQGAAVREAGNPNDTYVAAVFPDELDEHVGGEGAFSSAEKVFNAVAGTAAHEIGHTFDLRHVDRGGSQPYPIMATGSTGLTMADRLTARRFTDQDGTQPEGSSASMLLDAIGQVDRADFDMSGSVDGVDAARLPANWLRGDALFQEADADGDHAVDLLDAGAVFAGWTAAGGGTYSAAATYDPATGNVALSCSGVQLLMVRSPAGLLTGASADLGWTPANSMIQDDDCLVGFASFQAAAAAAGRDLGPVAPPGLEVGDLELVYFGAPGSGQVVAPVTVIPEPAILTLLAAATCLLLRRRRHICLPFCSPPRD